MKVRSALIAFVVLLLTASIASAATYKGYLSPDILIDGEPFTADVPPVIIDGRTLAPVRALAERLGYTVGWDDVRQVVTLNSPQQGGDVELEARIAELEEENSRLKRQLEGTSPPELPTDTGEVPELKFGEVFAGEGFDLTLSAPVFIENTHSGLTGYSAHVKILITAKKNSISSSGDLFQLELEAGHHSPSQPMRSSGQPGKVPPGESVTLTCRWLVESIPPEPYSITVYFSRPRTRLVKYAAAAGEVGSPPQQEYGTTYSDDRFDLTVYAPTLTEGQTADQVDVSYIAVAKRVSLGPLDSALSFRFVSDEPYAQELNEASSWITPPQSDGAPTIRSRRVGRDAIMNIQGIIVLYRGAPVVEFVP